MDTDLKKIIDDTLQEYFGSDPSKIGMDSGEKKYVTQEPGGQMAAVNTNESHQLTPEAFTGGYCAEFALALHKVTGLPIVSFDEHIVHGEDDVETQSIHYACKKGNNYLDVRGLRSEDEIRKNLIGSNFQVAKNVYIRKVSVDSLEDETEINTEAFRQAQQFIKKHKKTLLKEASFRVYNETLCPDLWDEFQHLDAEVRVNLLRMAYDFYKKTKFVAPIVDVYLMGSIANYNWTPDSDADVHILIDFNQLQMPGETASKVAKSAGAQWNNEHNAFVKGHKVEINVQSAKAEKPHVTGIYSLVKDFWVRKPTHMNVQVNKPMIQVKYTEVKKYLDKVIQDGDYEQMKTAKDFLDDFRQHGLDTAGELSVENIVYKILRAKGIVKQLKDSITAAYDKELSVTEIETDLNAIPMPQTEIAEPQREITQKDIDAKFPLPAAIYRGNVKLNLMTLGNLKSMRDKSKRFVNAFKGHEDKTILQYWKDDARMYDDEIKRRMTYINKPVMESYEKDPSYHAALDFHERCEKQRCEIAEFLKTHDKSVRVPWKTIPASLLKKVWYMFGKHNRIHTNGLDKIADQIMTNIARLYVANEFQGHSTNYDIQPQVEDECGFEFSEKEWNDNVWRFCDKNGNDFLSDYGIEPLMKIFSVIHTASTPEEKLYACDKALNVIHQRNDLAVMFVEGGSATLQAVAEQGGYNADYIPGQINREFRESAISEGFGLGNNPEDDRLVVPGHRWQIRSKDAPKTPKMKEEFDFRNDSPSIRVDKPRKDIEPPSYTTAESDYPMITPLLSDFEKILDRKFAKGIKFISLNDVNQIFEDLYYIHIAHIPNANKLYEPLRRIVLNYMSRDYDIRDNGYRIGEQLNERMDSLFIGYIDKSSFKIDAVRADKTASSSGPNSHGYFKRGIKWNTALAWRFRADQGILYWWPASTDSLIPSDLTMPDEKYRDEVVHYIKTRLGGDVKKHALIYGDLRDQSFNQSHAKDLSTEDQQTVNELVDQVIAGML